MLFLWNKCKLLIFHFKNILNIFMLVEMARVKSCLKKQLHIHCSVTVGPCPSPPPGSNAHIKGDIDRSDPAVVTARYECDEGHTRKNGRVRLQCTHQVFRGKPLACLPVCVFDHSLIPGKYKIPFSVLNICYQCKARLYFSAPQRKNICLSLLINYNFSLSQ